MTVEHTAAECFPAGRFAVLAACGSPSEAAQRARVYFRSGSEGEWRHVEMPRLGKCFRGVLPKPLPGVRQVSYYIEILDRTLAPVRTPPVAVPVTATGAACATLSLERADVQVGDSTGQETAKPGSGGGSSRAIALGVVAGGVAAAGLAVSQSGGGETSTTAPAASPSTLPSPPPTENTLPGTTTTTRPPRTTTTTTTTTPPNTRPTTTTTSTTTTTTRPTTTTTSTSTTSTTTTTTMPGTTSTTTSSTSTTTTSTSSTTTTTSPTSTSTTTSSTSSTTTMPASTMQGRPAQAPAGTARSAVCVVRWASQLDVPQGVGQVVFDGRALAFPEGGSYHADVAGPCGERRIEALLVRSAGQPGEWRFELAGPGFVPGSVRPLAGPVTQVSGSGVVARLGGAAGERVVFVFRTQP